MFVYMYTHKGGDSFNDSLNRIDLQSWPTYCCYLACVWGKIKYCLCEEQVGTAAFVYKYLKPVLGASRM